MREIARGRWPTSLNLQGWPRAPSPRTTCGVTRRVGHLQLSCRASPGARSTSYGDEDDDVNTLVANMSLDSVVDGGMARSPTANRMSVDSWPSGRRPPPLLPQPPPRRSPRACSRGVFGRVRRRRVAAAVAARVERPEAAAAAGDAADSGRSALCAVFSRGTPLKPAQRATVRLVGGPGGRHRASLSIGGGRGPR